MEGQGEPSEISLLKRDLEALAEDARNAGEWLATAMQSSWAVAAVLLDVDELADMLGERHRIIANNWQGASIMSLAARILQRAAELLDHIDFNPAAIRADIATSHASAGGCLRSRDDRPRRRSLQRLRRHSARQRATLAGLPKSCAGGRRRAFPSPDLATMRKLPVRHT